MESGARKLKKGAGGRRDTENESAVTQERTSRPTCRHQHPRLPQEKGHRKRINNACCKSKCEEKEGTC